MEKKMEIDTYNKCILISSDNKTYEVYKPMIVQSKLIHNILIDNEEEEMIPLPNIKGTILETCIHFMSYIYERYIIPKQKLPEISKPVKSNQLSKNIEDQWIVEFIVNLSDDQLVELMKAAHYMDIPFLLEVTCAAYACRILLTLQ